MLSRAISAARPGRNRRQRRGLARAAESQPIRVVAQGRVPMASPLTAWFARWRHNSRPALRAVAGILELVSGADHAAKSLPIGKRQRREPRTRVLLVLTSGGEGHQLRVAGESRSPSHGPMSPVPGGSRDTDTVADSAGSVIKDRRRCREAVGSCQLAASAHMSVTSCGGAVSTSRSRTPAAGARPRASERSSSIGRFSPGWPVRSRGAPARRHADGWRSRGVPRSWLRPVRAAAGGG